MKMLRKFFAAIALAGAVVTGQVAEAGFGSYATTNADFWAIDSDAAVNNAGSNPPVINIKELGYGDGTVFNNQIGGDAFAAGNTVRTIGAASLSSMVNGSVKPVKTTDGREIVSIIALEGVTTDTQGVAKFSAGSIWFSAVPDNTTPFDSFDTGTWNYSGAFAKFDLSAAKPIIDGAASGVSKSSDQFGFPNGVNFSSIDSFGEVGDGKFAFELDGDFYNGGFSDEDGNSISDSQGDSWMFNVEKPGSNPFEGLAITSDQLVQGISPDSISVPSTVDLNLLDEIMEDAIGSGKTFTADSFDPIGKDVTPDDVDAAQTGDFIAGVSGRMAPITAVPEPSSLAVFGLSLLGVGFVARRRMRHVNA